MYVAVDVGGTFTDVVIRGGAGGLYIGKSDTTPNDLTEGVVNAISKFTADMESVSYLFHGTTVIINSLLERKGARAALITTDGFRDVLEIARGIRREPYNFLLERRPPLVPRRHRFEVRERIAPDGASLASPDREEVLAIAREIRAQGLESIAVCLINSYVNSDHEQQVRAVLQEVLPDVPVTLSSDLVREWREFERTSTAVMNAYVTSIINRYLDTLIDRFTSLGFNGGLFMMQSSGGSMGVGAARRMPIALVESGPASGVVGAAQLSSTAGFEKAVAFDMGGTTAKASLVGPEMRPVRPYYVGRSKTEEGAPSLFSVTDIIEIGTGGGSIARVTATGGLEVGPESAGADPGPICYARGGESVTVTDANLVLGRLAAEEFLGGDFILDLEASRRAMNRDVAEPLGLDLEEAASGILQIANNAMALAVRQVSIERGEDPRRLALISFGGMGPTHAADIAQQLRIPFALIPPAPETFSAFGMLLTKVERRVAETFVGSLDDMQGEMLLQASQRLETQADEMLKEEAPESVETTFVHTAELRYMGQEQVLEVEFDTSTRPNLMLERLASDFHDTHLKTYGFAVKDEPIQLVTIAVTAHAGLDLPTLEDLVKASAGRVEEPDGAREITNRRVYFPDSGGFLDTRVVRRSEVPMLETLPGPLVVQEYGSTTIVPPGGDIQRDKNENLIISFGKGVGQ